MSDQFILGKYQTIEILGRGGFATVYRAKNTVLGNEVVLKILDPGLGNDESFIRRFRQEAQQTVRLDHPNIVRVLDLDKQDDKLFIVMEYVPGQNLRDVLAQRSLNLDQIVGIVRQMGNALDYAHKQQLVHRDIKPSNILVRSDGQVKLTDFGIVKAAEGAKLTLTGTTIGTPSYMSPEQSRGGNVDGRSDIYSLGIVAFELITGQVPFQGDTAAVIYKQIHEPPPLPSTVTARAKGPLEPVLLKALDKEPANRFQTGAALADALEKAAGEIQKVDVARQVEKTVVLMEQHQFSDAIRELEELQAFHPDYQNVADLLQKARQGMHLTKQYQEAAQHLQSARKLASEVVTKDPAFPDTAGVLQTLHAEKPAAKAGLSWFWIGSIILLTAYVSTTWVWVTAREKVTGSNLINETRTQMEGLAALFVAGVPWVAWVPLLSALLAMLLMVLENRRAVKGGKNTRPPVNQTGVMAKDAGKRPFSFLMLVRWLVLLVGLVGGVFVIASVHNLVGAITIAAALLIMLVADLRQFFKNR
jgi:serine/threonine protein kinase